MTVVNLEVNGGERLKAYLEALQARIDDAKGLRVGFLEHATYPAKSPKSPILHVAQVAFWNEFGTSRAPTRPFFRQMIAKDSGAWGESLGNYLTSSEFNATRALRLLGVEIQDELKESINAWPADNAPSTVKRKGFNHGLIDTAQMLRSVDFEVLK
jgi:hypothetical protein